MTRRVARSVGWLLLLSSVVDLVVRQLTRRTVLMWLGSADAWSPWLMAAVAVAGAAIVIGARQASSSPDAELKFRATYGTTESRATYGRTTYGRTTYGSTKSRATYPASRTSALFLALFAIGVAAQLQLGARLQSDGFYYYAYARSIWFDADVNLANDYRALGLDDAQHRHLFVPTVTGHAQTTWAIGPALLWSPFIGAGHAAAHLLRRSGADVATDGTSFPYRQSVCLAGLFYGLAGLFLCYAIARTTFGPRVSAASVAVVTLGSFVVWYLVREPTMSHPVSMASVAAFCVFWLQVRNRRSWLAWALLGLAGGVMTAVRWQNALVLVLPAASLGAAWPRSPVPDRRTLMRCAAIFGAGVFVGFLPQMIAWQAIYGRPVAASPIAPVMFWTRPQIADQLWSTRNGLFATSPALYLSAIGLVLLWKWNRLLSAAGLLLLAAMTWTNAAVEDWWGGAGYGARRFDSLVPFFVCGMAAFATSLSRLASRRPGLVVAAALGLLVVWNATLMSIARDGVYRIGQPVSFGDLAAAQATTLHDWIGHPPSYPANLVYAAQNGVSPAAYDLLRPYRFLGDPSRQYGRIDIGPGDDVYTGNGWHLVEHDGEIGFRWARVAAGVLLPLDRAADLLVQIRLRPYEYAGAAPQQLSIVVNGTRLPPMPIAGGWQVVEWQARAGMWRAGVNRVVLQFSRETRPSDVGGGGDDRPLAAAIDYVRIAATAGGER